MTTTSVTRERSAAANDLGLLLIRLIVGVVFLYHGSQKLFGAFGGPGLSGFAQALTGMNVPVPQLSAILAASAEFFGGAALLLGLFTRLAVVPLVFTMAVAILKAHPSAFSLQHSGMEYALTLLVVAASLGLTGPGGYSVDAVLKRRGLDRSPIVEAAVD